MLTQQQVTQWETFGFLHLRGVLNADEIEVINAEYEKGLNRTRDQMDSPVGNRRQLNWPNMGPDTPFLAGLLEDPRICGVAEQLFGDDVVGVASNGNHFAGDRTEWHPDTHDPHMQGVKFACYLQPLGAESGALRVIPGSHKSPCTTTCSACREKIPIDGRKNRPGSASASFLRTCAVRSPAT